MQTVACATVIGQPDNFRVWNFEGTSGWSDSEVTGVALSALKDSEKVADDDDSAFRQSYNDWDYESSQWTDSETEETTTYSPCKASLDLPKIGRDSSIFDEYTVKTGMRLYESMDSTTFETIIDPEASGSTFTYTLEEPTYEFGDEFEFDARPYDEAIFTGFNDFAMSDYVSDADGVGFQMVQGLFKAIPNFQTTMWIFKFSLEMPTQFFEENMDAYLFQWGTYQDTDGTLDEVTVSCGIKFDDPESI